MTVLIMGTSKVSMTALKSVTSQMEASSSLLGLNTLTTIQTVFAGLRLATLMVKMLVAITALRVQMCIPTVMVRHAGTTIDNKEGGQVQLLAQVTPAPVTATETINLK